MYGIAPWTNYFRTILLISHKDILELCKYIRRSMLAGRRTAPIAPDFESAFQALQVPTPEDQLPPQLKPKPPPPISLLPTPPPDEFFNTHELPDTILGPGLAGNEEKRKDRYVPSHFPAFPSQHTFKHTEVLPPRETDPRRIRELATEEGRLGEQALRKLAGSVRGEGKLDLSIEADDAPPAVTHSGRRGKKKAESMEGMFEETMKELAKSEKGGGADITSEGSGFEMAPIVNSERKYWMPDTTRRRPPRLEPAQSTAKNAAHHLATSEKARGKQRAAEPPARSGDDDLEMDFP
jgi:Transcription factor TFIID complex subunit 8 C-term